MLNCQKCGYSNELGRIFCHSCGTKLDLSQIKGPGQGGPRLKPKGQGGKSSGGWRTVRLLLELVVLVGILGAFYLMIQMPEEAPEKPGSAQVSAAEGKRFALDRLTTRGRPGKVVFTETEINAHLGSLQMEKAPQGWLVYAPSQVAMELLDGEVKAKMWGELRLGGSLTRPIYFSYSCVPVLTDQGLRPHTTGASIGALRLPAGVANAVPIVQRFLGAVFGRLGREREMLGKLSEINVTEQGATLEYQPTQ